MSASFGVSFANAADPGDGLKFCFIEDKEGTLDYFTGFAQVPLKERYCACSSLCRSCCEECSEGTSLGTGGQAIASFL